MIDKQIIKLCTVNIIKHETMWSNQKQAENRLIICSKAVIVYVAKYLFDFWFVMKD